MLLWLTLLCCFCLSLNINTACSWFRVRSETPTRVVVILSNVHPWGVHPSKHRSFSHLPSPSACKNNFYMLSGLYPSHYLGSVVKGVSVHQKSKLLQSLTRNCSTYCDNGKTTCCHFANAAQRRVKGPAAPAVAGRGRRPSKGPQGSQKKFCY